MHLNEKEIDDFIIDLYCKNIHLSDIETGTDEDWYSFAKRSQDFVSCISDEVKLQLDKKNITLANYLISKTERVIERGIKELTIEVVAGHTNDQEIESNKTLLYLTKGLFKEVIKVIFHRLNNKYNLKELEVFGAERMISESLNQNNKIELGCTPAQFAFIIDLLI